MSHRKTPGYAGRSLGEGWMAGCWAKSFATKCLSRYIHTMQKRIGIAGFGIVGKSALRFFQQKSNVSLSVWDKRELTPEERKLLVQAQAELFVGNLEEFFEQNDKVLSSPGFDLRLYKKYQNKFLSELDLFAQNFSKKTIAITGTLGKTSITRMLGKLLPGRTQIAGNVGYPMLDLISKQNKIDTAVLELSSFQTEQNNLFSPDISVWTNFYPNHLDRHATIDGYFDAKWKLFAKQKPHQKALFSVTLGERVQEHKGERAFVCEDKITKTLLQKDFLQEKIVYFIEDKKYYKARVMRGELVDKIVLGEGRSCTCSFMQNWLFVLAIFDLLTLEAPRGLEETCLERHRLEHFATINQIDFYNDSKATVMQATQAAVDRLEFNNRPIILIVGGLSKGVDRSELIRFLAQKKSIKKIFCLGCGCNEFDCYEQYASLPDLVRAIMQTALPGDQVLFSPSGASFDLFSCFEERGNLFKQAVKNYI